MDVSVTEAKSKLTQLVKHAENGRVFIAWSSHSDQFAYHGWVMAYDAATLAQTMIWSAAPDGTGFNGAGVWMAGRAPAIDPDGNVYYVTKDSRGQENFMKGDNAVYTQSSDTMVVTGGPVILQQGQNVMTGTRLVSQVKAGITTLDSAPTDAGKGRVRGVFYPEKSGALNPQAVTVPPSVKPAGQ